MKASTFDKIAGVAIALSVAYSLVAAMSWNWFPAPGDWGDIAHIPKSIKNYMALLLPPTITLLYLVIRRLYFSNNSKAH